MHSLVRTADPVTVETELRKKVTAAKFPLDRNFRKESTPVRQHHAIVPCIALRVSLDCSDLTPPMQLHRRVFDASELSGGIFVLTEFGQ